MQKQDFVSWITRKRVGTNKEQWRRILKETKVNERLSIQRRKKASNGNDFVNVILSYLVKRKLIY